jgi:ABC-type nitrate/sulfonate/bicarbonate transport system permease component
MPLLVVWFGITNTSAIVAAMLGTFFPLLIQSTRGSVQNDSTGAAGIIHSAKNRDILLSVLTAYRLAFLMVIAAEFVGSARGLGHLMMVAQSTLQVDLLWTAILITGFVALAVEGTAGLIRTGIIRA